MLATFHIGSLPLISIYLILPASGMARRRLRYAPFPAFGMVIPMALAACPVPRHSLAVDRGSLRRARRPIQPHGIRSRR